MANKYKGEIKIDIGGRERVMKLTLNDFAMLEQLNPGQTLLDILARLDKMDITLLRTLLFLSLRHDDKDLTEEQVGEFDFNLTELTAKLGECIAASLGGGSSEKKTKGESKGKKSK
jgi:hypothetical protein